MGFKKISCALGIWVFVAHTPFLFGEVPLVPSRHRVVLGDGPQAPDLAPMTTLRDSNGEISFYEIEKGTVLITETAVSKQHARLNQRMVNLNHPQRIFEALLPRTRIPTELKRAMDDWEVLSRQPRHRDARKVHFDPLAQDEKLSLSRFGVPRSVLDRPLPIPVRFPPIRPISHLSTYGEIDAIPDNEGACPYIDWFNSWVGAKAKYNNTCISGVSIYSGKSFFEGVSSWFAVSPESPASGFNHSYVGLGKVVRAGSIKQWVHVVNMNNDQQYYSWWLNSTGTPIEVKLISIAQQNTGYFDHAIYNDW